ncbi:hypothetical protein MTO96_001306 [Rhipicephalus appendiculatus]
MVFLTVAASTAAESFDGSDYQHVPISDNNCTCSVATAILDDVTGAFQWYQRKSTTSQASDCIKGDLQRFFFSGLGEAAGTMSLIRNYFFAVQFRFGRLRMEKSRMKKEEDKVGRAAIAAFDRVVGAAYPVCYASRAMRVPRAPQRRRNGPTLPPGPKEK